MFRKLFASLVLLSVTACASMSSQEMRDAGLAPEQIAIEYATLKLAARSHDTAVRVVKVTQEIRGYIDVTESVSVAGLKAYATSRIHWDDLDAADHLLVTKLINVVAIQLNDVAADGLVDPTKLVKVHEILDVIEATASRF